MVGDGYGASLINPPPHIIDPDNYNRNTNLNQVFPGVTFSSTNALYPTAGVRNYPHYAPLAHRGNVFARIASDGRGSVGTWDNLYKFRVDFDSPVSSVSIDATATSDYTTARLMAYDGNGRELDVDLEILSQGESLTLTVSSDGIAYITAWAFRQLSLDTLSFIQDPYTVTLEPGETVTGINFGNQFASILPYPNQEAAYSFSEGSGTIVEEISPNTNTLDLNNGVSWSNSNERSGSQLNLDGDNDYGEIANLEIGGAFTFAANVNYDTFQYGSRIFDFGNGSVQLLNRRTGDDLIFRVSYQGQGAASLTIEDFWETNTWVHVTATISETGTLSVYKNGALAGTTDTTLPPPP